MERSDIIHIFRLARITSAPEDRRNVSELYRRMPLYKLEELVPEVKWRRYLSVVMNRDVKSNETVVLFALTYVRVCIFTFIFFRMNAFSYFILIAIYI